VIKCHASYLGGKFESYWVLLTDIYVPLMFLMCEDSLSCPLIIRNHCFISDCMLSKPAFFFLPLGRRHHHHISVMELGHMWTSSSLT